MEKKKYSNTYLIVFFISLFCFVVPGFQLLSEEPASDYNTYYKYPLAFGIEYQNLLPLSRYVDDYGFILFDVSGILELPLKEIPQLKPLVRTGVMFTQGDNKSTDSDLPDNKYNQTSFLLGAGMVYSHRFSKIFEAGIEISGGFEYTSFPYLLPDNEPRSSTSLFIDCKFPVTIDPIFNLGIDFQPGIRYRYSLSPFHYFDGFLFSFGGAINFRLGDDPDISGAIRSIRFNNISLASLFAGMQSYYISNPAGFVSITNIEKYRISDVKVSFFQAGFMDSPTPAETIVELKPGETREIPIYVSFNSEIFTTEGITPLTGEVIVSYMAKDKPGSQAESVVYDLYDKTSLTWDDDRKIGAYITPSDGILKDYTSYILQAAKDKLLLTYNNPLQTAVLLYSALTEIGCIYQADPVLPFVSTQKNTQLVDTINLPRDTLRRISGDCDDLTVLYISMLETLGIESGFVTVPGHIYPVVNTGVPVRHFKKIHPERSMTLNVMGTVWVPVEMTMLGKGDFLSAWEAGVREWFAWDEMVESRKFYLTKEAQKLYRPVGLKKQKVDFSFGNSLTIANRFHENLASLSRIVIQDHELAARGSDQKTDYNKLGIIYAYFNKPEKAAQAFQKAIERDPDYFLAVINLGNLFFQTGKYSDALSQYVSALKYFKENETAPRLTYIKLLLKISVVYYQIKEYDDAKEYFLAAQELSPEETALYSYLKKEDQEKTRSQELAGYYLALQYIEDE